MPRKLVRFLTNYANVHISFYQDNSSNSHYVKILLREPEVATPAALGYRLCPLQGNTDGREHDKI